MDFSRSLLADQWIGQVEGVIGMWMVFKIICLRSLKLSISRYKKIEVIKIEVMGWGPGVFQHFRSWQWDWDAKKLDREQVEWLHGSPEWLKKKKSNVFSRAEMWSKMTVEMSWWPFDWDIYTTIINSNESNEWTWEKSREWWQGRGGGNQPQGLICSIDATLQKTSSPLL